MPETNNKREEQMISVQNEAFLLFQKKNKDYGDAFAKYGPVGVLMRMGDKISRLQSITKSGIVLVNDEKIRDTLIDLHNYSAMCVMLLDEGNEIPIKNEIENENESENDSESENESYLNADQENDKNWIMTEEEKRKIQFELASEMIHNFFIGCMFAFVIKLGLSV